MYVRTPRVRQRGGCDGRGHTARLRHDRLHSQVLGWVPFALEKNTLVYPAGLCCLLYCQTVSPISCFLFFTVDHPELRFVRLQGHAASRVLRSHIFLLPSLRRGRRNASIAHQYHMADTSTVFEEPEPYRQTYSSGLQYSRVSRVRVIVSSSESFFCEWAKSGSTDAGMVLLLCTAGGTTLARFRAGYPELNRAHTAVLYYGVVSYNTHTHTVLFPVHLQTTLQMCSQLRDIITSVYKCLSHQCTMLYTAVGIRRRYVGSTILVAPLNFSPDEPDRILGSSTPHNVGVCLYL